VYGPLTCPLSRAPTITGSAGPGGSGGESMGADGAGAVGVNCNLGFLGVSGDGGLGALFKKQRGSEGLPLAGQGDLFSQVSFTSALDTYARSSTPCPH